MIQHSSLIDAKRSSFFTFCYRQFLLLTLLQFYSYFSASCTQRVERTRFRGQNKGIKITIPKLATCDLFIEFNFVDVV